MKLRLFALAVFVLLSTAVPAAAQTLVRVPQDAATLQQAIDQVPDGGIIQLAAGTYPAPANGFRIRNARKSFTVRAAAGAQVILDGQGSQPVLRFENNDFAQGRPVTFEDLTFRNGRSTQDSVAGGVTVLRAEARFARCRFESNAADAPSTGGGGTLVNFGSVASFADCTWAGNTSPNRGGGLAVEFATAFIHGGRFLGNRVNVPGHISTAPGGGIYILDSTVRIFDSHFEDNRAGWVGGALYAFGTWTAPESVPAADVIVTGSAFVANQPDPDPCCPPPTTTFGGAIHAEDQATVRVYGSTFLSNRADRGGAVNSYRAVVEIHGSVLRGNQATATPAEVPVGGGIFIASADFADATTNFGAINRRPAQLTVTDSLLEGRFGGVGPVAASGGCVSASGDTNRMYGEGGVPQNGALADNRARVTLARVVLHDCDVERPPGGAGGFGGALAAELVDLALVDSLVLRSDALGDGAGGGALAVGQESRVVIAGTTFARNTATNAGGALRLGGSEIEISGSNFFQNEISPGVAENDLQSLGAAIFALPLFASPAFPNRPARNITGTVAGSVFSGNVGMTIRDVDTDEGPINDLRYDGNRFFATTFGDRVYAHNLNARAGISPAGLNGLVVNRGNGTSTDKSQAANTRATSAITAGGLLAVPPSLPTPVAAAGAPDAFLAFAWSGGSATLGGQPLADRVGLDPVAAAGGFSLRVDGATVANAALDPPTCTTGPLLCLADDRFRVVVTFQQGNLGGVGTALPLTGDSGLYFFDQDQVEAVLRILDGRPVNGRFWVGLGTLSSAATTAAVLDSVRATFKSYVSPAGQRLRVLDTGTF